MAAYKICCRRVLSFINYNPQEVFMNNGEKIEGREIKANSKFIKWLDNFWYHHKWATIIVSFFVIVFLVCILQMCTREKVDITVVYAGGAFVTEEKTANVELAIEAVMPEDFDKDGNKNAALIRYEIYSEDQIKEMEKDKANGGQGQFVDHSFNSSNYKDFYNYVQTGDASVYFLDPWIFENLKENNRLMEISEVLGHTLEASEDNFGVKLGDLTIYKKYATIRALPKNTVVCILRPAIAGNSADPEYYANEIAMFRAIIECAE